MKSNESQAYKLVKSYIILTKQVIPKMAIDTELQWPVQNDHCFQRIILDNICNVFQYDHLNHPANKHLIKKQALKAVKLCEDIISGNADLYALNRQLLIWRDKKVRQKNK